MSAPDLLWLLTMCGERQKTAVMQLNRHAVADYDSVEHQLYVTQSVRHDSEQTDNHDAHAISLTRTKSTLSSLHKV